MADLDRTAKFVDNWWKILSVGVAIIFFIYNISSQWIKVKELGDQIILQSEKSDKRYEETIKMYKEIKTRYRI